MTASKGDTLSAKETLHNCMLPAPIRMYGALLPDLITQAVQHKSFSPSQTTNYQVIGTDETGVSARYGYGACNGL